MVADEIALENKRKQLSTLKQNQDNNRSVQMDKTENYSEKSHTSPTHTREQVAKLSGVGTGTVARYDIFNLLQSVIPYCIMSHRRKNMLVPINEFINNTYHYIMQTLKSDSFTKVSTKHGNVVIMSEEKYNCLIELLTAKQEDIT